MPEPTAHPKHRGRPKMDEKARRGWVLSIRLTEDELDMIENAAFLADVTPSEFARSAALTSARTATD